ncbi:chaperonin 10-like protein [Exophiala viscosa]|uniref:Chaperonin 10-like protein n=1 Tax=Exophiala viscosa TaxID=2486360 RepID=A0AAN6IH91_9EURO|nr:chaperonin 10-like protein [Exophiala viscosa]
MRKVVYHEYGNPVNVLKIENGPEPAAPGFGQVLVKVTKRPVHNGDLLVVKGGHDPIKREIPAEGYISGCEGVGIIQALGSGIGSARNLRVGDRVAFFAVGSWQESILIPADFATPVPSDMDDELAAQLHINPVAALLLTRLTTKIAASPKSGVLRISAVEAVLEDLGASRMEAGVVLLSAAGSLVARLAATMLKAQGYTPIALVRSSALSEALQKATGITVIGTDQENWQEEVLKAAAGRKIFAALDAVGGHIGETLLTLLSPAGTLVSYGSLSGDPIPVDHVHLCMSAKTVCGIGMVHWTQLPYGSRAVEMASIIQLVRDNQKLFKIAGEFPLSEAADAVRLFRQPGRDGTVLLSS